MPRCLVGGREERVCIMAVTAIRGVAAFRQRCQLLKMSVSVAIVATSMLDFIIDEFVVITRCVAGLACYLSMGSR